MLYPELSNRILGIAMQLHREMGCGFKEKVYQDAFDVLLKENKINYVKEKHNLHVSNHKLGLLLNFGATSLEYRWYPNEWHYREKASIG